MEDILKKLVESGLMYGYSVDYVDGGKGIVVAESDEDAKYKIISSYLKHGYNESEFSDLEVWQIEKEDRMFDNGIVEIFE